MSSSNIFYLPLEYESQLFVPRPVSMWNPRWGSVPVFIQKPTATCDFPGGLNPHPPSGSTHRKFLCHGVFTYYNWNGWLRSRILRNIRIMTGIRYNNTCKHFRPFRSGPTNHRAWYEYKLLGTLVAFRKVFIFCENVNSEIKQISSIITQHAI